MNMTEEQAIDSHNRAVDVSVRLNDWMSENEVPPAIAMMAAAMWITAMNKCAGIPKSVVTSMIVMGIEAYWEEEKCQAQLN